MLYNSPSRIKNVFKEIREHVRTAAALALLCGVLVALQGCDRKSSVEIVRRGYLPSNTTQAVGDALANYRYFGATSWREETKENGDRTAEFTGVIDHQKAVANFTEEKQGDPGYAQLVQALGTATNAYVKITFTIDRDDTFRLSDKDSVVAITLGMQGGKERAGLFRAGTLQAIYENKNLFIPQYQL